MVQLLAKSVFIPLGKQQQHHQQMKGPILPHSHVQRASDWQLPSVLPIDYGFSKFKLGGSMFLNCLSWRLTYTSLEDRLFCFLPLPNPKSAQHTVHFVLHFRANAVCFFSTLNPGFSVSIGLGEIVLTRCSLFILHFHKGIVLSINPNASYILVWGPGIMMNKISFFWQGCTVDYLSLKKLPYN